MPPKAQQMLCPKAGAGGTRAHFLQMPCLRSAARCPAEFTGLYNGLPGQGRLIKVFILRQKPENASQETHAGADFQKTHTAFQMKDELQQPASCLIRQYDGPAPLKRHAGGLMQQRPAENSAGRCWFILKETSQQSLR